ncbi:MAG: hypothetical protein KH321_00990 [Clostridium sp.]|jgi:hypothetical protein|nr:hypothetical protein [Clostridium sp.]
MGMAASQARYLGLTARKTNVEYEGQQVNQQRTALANESAGLFRRLLALEVPTAPTQTDYYSDNYTYSDSSATADGKVTVSNITENEGSNPPTYTVDISYNVDAMQYQAQNNQQVYTTKNDDGTYELHFKDGTSKTIKKVEGNLSETLVNEMNKAGGTTENHVDDEYYTYTNTANNATYYINATASKFDPEKTNTQQAVNLYSQIKTTESVSEQLKNVTMTKSSDGNYTKMTWTDENGVVQNRTLSAGRDYDSDAYDQAMQQYNIDKANYDKEIADINAKTEELQQTDRTLELRLKQLDTEQEALQTELDSVKKVIDKNVDNIFKTFQ